jgi:hypothetical protein
MTSPYGRTRTDLEWWVPASYDIEKEGQVVAVFTLTKSAYRLGETVSGVMTFNRGDTPRRVLKVHTSQPYSPRQIS